MIRMIALALASFILVACSEGVQLGTGQNADPVVVDFPIAYVKAPLPLDDNGVFEQQDVREQITFEYGADLYYRARAAVGADAINITGEITQGRGAIRDVEGITELSFPAFSRSVTSGGGDKDDPGEINVPISCGNTVVIP